MKPILMTISFLALAACLVSSVLCAKNIIDSGTNKIILLAGTIIWFTAAPLWMRHKQS